MKTIIQTIGPLYGDDANGTVFGQPNGSVYTPQFNQLIVISEDAAVNRVFNVGSAVYVGAAKPIFQSRVKFNVICQVKWTAILELATDSAFTAIVCSLKSLNLSGSLVDMLVFGSGYTVVNGTTYYGRVRIVETNGGAEIMKSGTYTFTGAV